MTVYVDDARIPYRGMLMSHMIADTPEELRAMAAKIGVQARWIQFPGTAKEHFDICATKRAAAIKAGARLVTTQEIVRKIRERRTAFPETRRMRRA